MKAIIHIGTEKTGSTSFQKWGDLNRDTLLENAVFYSQVLGRENHLKAYLWALPPDAADEGFSQVGIHSPAERQIFLKTLPVQLQQEVRRARDRGCHTYIISNEHCHSRLKSQADLVRLHSLLARHFDQIEILCSLRPQIDVAISLASTATRVGLKVGKDFFDQATADNKYYNYFDLVNRWSQVFGAENVTLVPFRRSPDMSLYLIERLRLPAHQLITPPRLNEALDVRAMAMVNALVPANKLLGEDRPPLNLMLDQLPCTQRLRPGLALAKSVQERFDESNLDLARSRKDVTVLDLDPDWRRHDVPSNMDILEQPCAFAEPLVQLLDLYQQRIALSRALELAALAERAQMFGNSSRIAEYLRDARQSLLLISETSPFYAQRQEAETRVLKVSGDL